jgi:hypothetical protein
VRREADDDEGGRGLFVVEAMSACWGVWRPVAGGKVVYAELEVTPSLETVATRMEVPEQVREMEHFDLPRAL